MTKAEFTLPEPTGQYAVGTQDLHLVDEARQDPWEPDTQREIMISLWYPTEETSGFTQQHWMPAGTQGAVDSLVGAAGIAPGSVDWAGATTSGYLDAPVLDGDWPVVLYSPGLAGTRTQGTVLVQELASQGYLVVTMDHTFEAPVEFPDGRVVNAIEVPEDKLSTAAEVRVGDTRFVLDQLAEQGWNLDHVGMFGHSFGGFTTAEAMLVDDRIDAGMNLDGHLFTDLGTVAEEGLDQPLFLFGRQQPTEDGEIVDHSPFTDLDTTWGVFWENTSGPKQSEVLPSSGHMSFTDMQVILPQLIEPLDLPADRWAGAIGTIDPAESIETQSATILDFFGTNLS